MSYSQNNEEEVILHELARHGCANGRFLDLGAYDGKTYSNTLRLVEMGWSGVCFEPAPSAFQELLALHGDNASISLVNAAVSVSGGMSFFWESKGDGLSTTSGNHMLKWKEAWPTDYKRFSVYTVPLAEVFTSFGTHYDFINIDVEGGNTALFEALPFEQLEQVKVICVEHDDNYDKMTNLAVSHGFRIASRNGENLILSRVCEH